MSSYGLIAYIIVTCTVAVVCKALAVADNFIDRVIKKVVQLSTYVVVGI